MEVGIIVGECIRMGLTVQDKDKDSQTDSCSAASDSLQVTERSAGALT